jgi:S1-C subfamily serine protease
MDHPVDLPTPFTWPEPEPPAPPAASPDPRRRRAGRGPLMAGAVAVLAVGLGGGALLANTVGHHDTAITSTGSSATPAVNTATLPAGAQGSAVAVAAALDKAVATIVVSSSVQNRFGQTGTGTAEGSGFVISNDGGLSYLLTNNHVVAGAQSLQVILSDGRTLTGSVVGTDALDDLAVVSVQDGKLPQVVFGRSADLKVGQQVVAIGSPLGNQNSVTSGVISALHRSITAGEQGGSSENLSDVLQTDAAINPGNSGGPLADLAGRVIGVNVATSSNGSNVSFSIPSDQAQRVAQDLIARRSVDHPYLGVGFLTPLDAAENGRSFSGPGVLVTQVASGSPAAQAGLQVNDVVTAVDGTALDTSQTLGGLLGTHKVGEVVKLTVRRGGQTLTLDATLVQRPTA